MTGRVSPGWTAARRCATRLRRPAALVRVQLVAFVPGVQVEAVEEDGTVAGVGLLSQAGQPQWLSQPGNRLAELPRHYQRRPDPLAGAVCRQTTRSAGKAEGGF